MTDRQFVSRICPSLKCISLGKLGNNHFAIVCWEAHEAFWGIFEKGKTKRDTWHSAAEKLKKQMLEKLES